MRKKHSKKYWRFAFTTTWSNIQFKARRSTSIFTFNSSFRPLPALIQKKYQMLCMLTLQLTAKKLCSRFSQVLRQSTKKFLASQTSWWLLKMTKHTNTYATELKTRLCIAKNFSGNCPSLGTGTSWKILICAIWSILWCRSQGHCSKMRVQSIYTNINFTVLQLENYP